MAFLRYDGFQMIAGHTDHFVLLRDKQRTQPTLKHDQEYLIDSNTASNAPLLSAMLYIFP